MKSCNRVIFSVFVLFVVLTGCGTDQPDFSTTTIQNVGLVQTSGAPPLGEAIAPLSGLAGDGAAVVTGAGSTVGGSTGPGAVRWHGGQWIMPYSATPHNTLANASCDVVPRADATALVELVSSNGQVLGSSTVPATSSNIVIRAWPFIGSHAVLDGEQIAMRIAPRDSTTGAWTSASQDVTVIGCAVNMSTVRTLVVPVVPPTLGRLVTAFSQVSGLDSNPATAPVDLYVPLPLPIGTTISTIRARVQDAGGPTRVQATLWQQHDGPPTQTMALLVNGPSSSGSGAEETISFSPGTVTQSANQYIVKFANSAGILSSTIFRLELDIMP